MSRPDKFYQWFSVSRGDTANGFPQRLLLGPLTVWISGLDAGIENMLRMSVMDANIYDEDRPGS